MNREYDRRLLKFEKIGKMKFIGHLDLLRIFQGAIRRAKLPIAYSNGFNPHQKMVFALPLPLGMQGTSEYLELFFDKSDKLDKLDRTDKSTKNEVDIFALNDYLPTGLRILECYEISEKTPGPAGAVKAAEYRLIFDGIQNTAPYLQQLLASPQIIALKKTKKAVKETDIRPDIFALKLESGETAIYMHLSAGSGRNLNPLLVASQIFDKMGIVMPEHEISITRGNLFACINENAEYSLENSRFLWQIKEF